MRRYYFGLLIAILLLFPITSYAKETVDYNEAKIRFSIDETKWKETSLTTERTYIDKKWTNECGTIMTGTYDIYGELSEDELEGITREYFNYENLLRNEDDAISLLEEFKNIYSVDNWNYKYYKMKFIEFSGKMQQNGIDIDYDFYLTINNGYGFMIQYMRIDSVNKGTCENPISEIAASAESTISVKKMEEKNMDVLSYIIYLIIGMVLTCICYEAYPFIRVVLMKKEYNEQEGRKMALWNSIIVGFIFLMLTLSTSENATWSVGPALLYYYINRGLWVKNETENNQNQKKEETKKDEIENNQNQKKEETKKDEIENKNEFKCSECGEIVPMSANKCPNCGTEFEDDELDEYDDEDIIVEKRIKNKNNNKDKERESESKEKKEEKTFKCSECGEIIPETASKCPHCGVSFEDDENEEEIKDNKDYSIEKKDKDLRRLKKLLDEDIITKEEFEKEKKKILK